MRLCRPHSPRTLNRCRCDCWFGQVWRGVNSDDEEIIAAALFPVRSESNEAPVAADGRFRRGPIVRTLRFIIDDGPSVTDAPNALTAVERNLQYLIVIDARSGELARGISMGPDGNPVLVISQHRSMKVVRPVGHAAVSSDRGAKVEDPTWRMR